MQSVNLSLYLYESANAVDYNLNVFDSHTISHFSTKNCLIMDVNTNYKFRTLIFVGQEMKVSPYKE